ncbi:sensor histidine kinase [Plantactinospora sp. KBS50]|uniref:sensor histidine kinase n=1 Tax=Plantactinospora sp. KBS50 TaxID=2024580 RepID=UPI000BAAC832|nr:histidine kinase [Plantactinospora sp. KBS50]ASW52957.1 two-component sensor histidine kinase [Plantactinospora sp. KBS50]
MRVRQPDPAPCTAGHGPPAAVLRLIDGGLAGVVFGILAVALAALPSAPATPAGLVLGYGLAAVQAGCLLWLRRRPGSGLAVAALAGIGLEAMIPEVGWLGLVAVPLTYLARLRPPRVSLVALGLLLLPTPWKLATGGWRDLLLAVVGLAFAWTIGELQRGHAQRRAAERDRILTTERERISRELHDVVAHHVAVIAVQAGAAEDVFDLRPERARAALGTIRTAATSAMVELRAMLNTLAQDPEGAANAPQPGLAQLDALAQTVRAAGLQVRLSCSGAEPGRLPGGVQLSAYRIVQESLTNTLRHGHATRADVLVRHDDSGLELEVVDDGSVLGWPGGGGGRGLVGMRERARSLGGTLDAGPLPGGGFRVRAHLPVAGS